MDTSFTSLLSIGIDMAVCGLSSYIIQRTLCHKTPETSESYRPRQTSSSRTPLPILRILCTLAIASASVARWKFKEAVSQEYSDAIKLVGALSLGFIAKIDADSALDSEQHLVPANRVLGGFCAAVVISAMISSRRLFFNFLLTHN